MTTSMVYVILCMLFFFTFPVLYSLFYMYVRSEQTIYKATNLFASGFPSRLLLPISSGQTSNPLKEVTSCPNKHLQIFWNNWNCDYSVILAASGLSLPYAPENLRLNSSKLTYLFLSFFFAQERINVRLNISSSNLAEPKVDFGGNAF